MIRALAAAALATWTGTAAAGALGITDDTGREVRLQDPAQRVVTLAPHATELVTAAGAGGQLVGIAAGVDPSAELHRLPRIGGPGPLDRERLLALQPDLVIAWQSGNRPADLEWMARSGMPVYRSEPRTLDDIARAIRAIGELTGHRNEARRAAAAFTAAVETPCADLPRLPVYVEVWDRPAMSLGGNHWLNAVLHAAGWRNALAHYPHGVIPVSAEAVIGVADLPRVSLLRRYDGSTADVLADRLSRPGPRLAEAVRLLCRQRRDISGQTPP